MKLLDDILGAVVLDEQTFEFGLQLLLEKLVVRPGVAQESLKYAADVYGSNLAADIYGLRIR